MKNKQQIRKICICGVFGCLSFVLMLLEFSVSFIMPEFIKFDFSEIPALIASFAYGPIYGVLVCLVKNILHLPLTTTGCIGECSNFILGAIFVGCAGLVYSKMRSRKGALIGSLVGSAVMAIISVFTNYFIVYPLYSVVLKLPLNVILGMYKVIMPSVDNLFDAIVIFNLPFNFVKCIIASIICFAVYKRISPILKKTKAERNDT